MTVVGHLMYMYHTYDPLLQIVCFLQICLCGITPGQNPICEIGVNDSIIQSFLWAVDFSLVLS